MDKRIKKWLLLCLSVALLAGCTTEKSEDTEDMYMNITAVQAKEIMDTAENYIILDVRSQEEYDTGHIPGAILIPHTQVQAQAQLVLTDKDQLILVYCRSGRRSKLAAETLVELGYTNIKEFGGILDWPYETE